MKKVLSVALMLLSSCINAFAVDAASPQNPIASFLPLIVIFVIFYFLLIRPQQKKQKDHLKLLNALKKDDRVITGGGIYGTVVAVKGDIVEIKVAENVKIQVAKPSVSAVITEEAMKAAEKSGDKPAETKAPDIIK